MTIEDAAKDPRYHMLSIQMLSRPVMVQEFCRLHNYTPPQSPLDKLIDQNTGRNEWLAAAWGQFVFFIFRGLPASALADLDRMVGGGGE